MSTHRNYRPFKGFFRKYPQPGLLKNSLVYTLAKITLVKISAENYKGISYVRISSLPKEQSVNIQLSVNHRLIIKILKDGILLHDCLQYSHYVAWYETTYKTKMNEVKIGDQSHNWAIAS